jgi:hypothetical protein
MAIIKDRPTQFGINAQYHRLRRVEVDANMSEIYLHVEVYPSAEARETASNPLYVERMIVPFWRMGEDPRATFYKLLTDYDDSPLFEGDADDDPGAVPQFTFKPPQMPPMPEQPTEPPAETP